MTDKPLVIIIPGSKSKEARNIPVLRSFLARFYKHFGVTVEGYSWIPPLKSEFENIPADTVVFEWSGGISPFAVRRAAVNLKKLLEANSNREVILFTKSLGGVVAEKALEGSMSSVKKLIYVATPHFVFNRPLLREIEVVNIYSEADSYHKLAHKALYLGFGRQEIPAANNIMIPDVTHSGFNHNVEVLISGKKQLLFDFYKEVLRG